MIVTRTRSTSESVIDRVTGVPLVTSTLTAFSFSVSVGVLLRQSVELWVRLLHSLV